MLQENESFWKKKGFYVCACVLLVGVMAVGALFYRQVGLGDTQEEMMADIATEIPADSAEISGAGAVDTETEKDQQAAQANANVTAKPESTAEATEDSDAQKTSEPKKKTKKKSQSTAEKEEDTSDTKNTSNTVKSSQLQYNFNEENGLLWPVEGDVILKYSMTNTIYFETLAQYKCNPGIAISAKKGTDVKASADGKITDIAEDAEYGTMVTMDIGNNYTLKYGQLADVTVKKGDEVKEGDVIGSVAQPTKYFTKEGSNLYFQVVQKEESVDPLLLLR
ncbi:MAG: M23 family metallopeptidase [Clostridiaceae bacterium]|nr:M23 family metallopeptidase [Clostridiaceae bacterium]